MKRYIKILLVLSYMIQEDLCAEVIHSVVSEAKVAIVSKSAEEAQQLALRRARANAIEKANGVKIISSTLIKDGKLALDFLKSYTSGIIIKEEIEWLPMSIYQKDNKSAPIPEYHVKIKADIQLIKRNTDLNIEAKLNRKIFRENELMHINLKVSDTANIAMFFLGVDDRLYKIIPDIDDSLRVPSGQVVLYPPLKSDLQFEMKTLPNYNEVSEAVWIIATKDSSGVNFSKIFLSSEYSLIEFFEIYAEVATKCTEKILPYSVIK